MLATLRANQFQTEWQGTPQQVGRVLAPGRNDASILYHEDNGPLKSPSTMYYPLWNNDTLPRGEFQGSILKINEKLSFDNVEKLVLLIVLMPMIFTLHHANTNQ